MPRAKGGRADCVVLLHWGSTGAGPRFTFELARALNARGDVRVAVSGVEGAERSGDFAALGVDRLSVKTYSRPAGVLRVSRLVANILRFRRFLRRVDADVVVTPMFSLWQSLAIRWLVPRRVRFVATVHDADPHPGDDHFLKRWAQAAEVRRADGLVVLSEAVAAGVRARWRPTVPIHVTVHGAFGSDWEAVPRIAPSNDPPVIGFFGRILPYKGVDLLVETARWLADNGTEVVTHVHGSGELPPVPAGQVRVVWDLGWVPEEETNRIVGGFDVLVLPYREASQSGVLAIAMAEGVPVVATPVGGLAEQVRASGCGIVASAISAPALGAAVVRLLSADGAYEACSRSGLESASLAYGWERVGSDYVHAVESVMAR